MTVRLPASALGRLRALLFGSLLVLAASGCGSGGSKGPLHVQTTASVIHGPVLVEHISYTTFDGSRIPALLSLPRAYPARGCLIWEGPVGWSKQASATLWGPAARLGLAVFAIDLRDQGQRRRPGGLALAVRNPELVSRPISGSVKDLEQAMDYLSNQPSCRHNVGYVGQGLGGIVGSILAAQDRRIHAVILIAVPPSWRALIGSGNSAFLHGKAIPPSALEAIVRALTPFDPERWIGRIAPRPSLLLFATDDPALPVAAARRTAAAAGEPKTVIYYNAANDPLLGAVSAGGANPIEVFLLKYLVEPTFSAPRPNLPPLP